MDQTSYERDILYQKINGIFGLITDYDKGTFYTKCEVAPKESFIRFILKYYIYINSFNPTCIPFHLYLQFLKVIPIDLDQKNGTIFLCKECGLYAVPTPNNQYFAYVGNWNENGLKYHINNYIMNYNESRKKRIPTPEIYHEDLQQDLFIKLHDTHENHHCMKSDIQRYTTINTLGDTIYERYNNMLNYITIFQQNDKIIQLQNYLYLVLDRLKIGSSINKEIVIPFIIDSVKTYMNRTKKSNIYSICACYSFIVLNNISEPKIRIMMTTKRKTGEIRYDFSTRKIGNIFDIHYVTLQVNINQIYQDIIKEKKDV